MPSPGTLQIIIPRVKYYKKTRFVLPELLVCGQRIIPNRLTKGFLGRICLLTNSTVMPSPGPSQIIIPRVKYYQKPCFVFARTPRLRTAYHTYPSY
jgi:hypothetical protein